MRPLKDRLRGVLGGEKGKTAALETGGEAGVRRGLVALTEERLAPSHTHGADTLGTAVGASFAALARLVGDPAVGDCGLTDCLFLDTETTGLAGGAGTMVFLCGTARFLAGGTLLYRQHFLTGPGAERSFLQGILDDLAATKMLVTFSGKSFDRHRLADRLVCLGMDETVRRQVHLDLLHPARRVWRTYLPDTRLATLERHVLKLEREDDLPGSACPELYLSWLRSHAVDLTPAAAHNRLDVLSLVTLLGRLGVDPEAGAAPRPLLAAHAKVAMKGEPTRAAVLYGRAGRRLEQGRALEKARDYAGARKLFEVLAGEGEREARFALGVLLARRLKEREAARGVLTGVLDHYVPGDKEYDEALRWLGKLAP